MTLIRNVSPLGEVQNAFTGVVEAGAEVDVADEIAAELVEQESWELVEPATKPKATKASNTQEG